LPTASNPGNYSGNGQKMNITLHQSLVNTSTIEFTNLDDSNSFTEPFPRFSSYNTSFINISINGIYAPNKSLIIEDDDISSTLLSIGYYTSFKVRGSCYLENISIRIRAGSGGDTFNVDIYNATQSGSYTKFDKDLNGPAVLKSIVVTNTNAYWENLTNLHLLLNVSKTFDNTFFVRVSTVKGNGYWHNENENDRDDTISWRENGASPESNLDLNLKVGVSPLNNDPLPSQIGLKINNSFVSDISQRKGYWSKSTPITTNKDKLQFIITNNWWNVSLNITRVQINYTKTNIKANSRFEIIGSGGIVQWNISIPGGVHSFDSRISDFNTINFTIPANWLENTIKVFNNTIQVPSSNINKWLLGNGYREVQVLKTTNGTNWYLTANSTNLMSSIKMYKTSTSITAANFSDIVKFNATFSKKIGNGNVNLTIYSPQPRRLNHTKLLDISTQSPDSEFLISTWDLSDNVTKYGIFQVLMHWDNGTDAGFLETTLTIFGDTELKIMTPSLPTYNSSEFFDVRVYFNDTGLNKGIPASNFFYRIENGSIRTDNINILGDGNYSVTIYCNDNDFNGYGPKTVYFYAEEHYYNNQSTSIQFRILGETDLVIIRPQNYTVFNSRDSFNVTLFYNDTVKNEGISGANIQYSLNGGTSYTSDNITSIGQGMYNITILASDPQFPSYGLNNLIFNISRQDYHNQSKLLTIKILGETSLNLIKVPDKTYYRSTETFNITAYYNDTIKNIGISGARISVYVGNEDYTSNANVFDNGDGYYNITIDCSDSVFHKYQTFTIRVNASLENYYNQSNTEDASIVGETLIVVLGPPLKTPYVLGQYFNITIQYNDTVRNKGISGATIQYKLDPTAAFKSPTNTYYMGVGKYKIPVYTSDADFVGFGFKTIVINASKANYTMVSTTFVFHRQINTTIAPSNYKDLGEVTRGLNVTYTFNYSDYTGKPISKLNWSIVGSSYNFKIHFQNLGNGNYTIHINTTNVNVAGSPYTLTFNVSALGNESQVIRVRINVKIIYTSLEQVSWKNLIARNSGLNQTFKFYFNDTVNNVPITGLTTSDVIERAGFWMVYALR